MFLLLFLLSSLSLVALIIGLINPRIVIKWGVKKTRGKVVKLYGISMIVFCILFVVSVPEETPKVSANENRVKEEKQGSPASEKSKDGREIKNNDKSSSKPIKETKREVEPNVINTLGNTMGNIRNYGKAAKQGVWVYYKSGKNNEPIGAINGKEQGSKLYKMRIDGSKKKLVSKDQPSYINVIGEWIYYINTSDNEIYKVKTNGKSRAKLTNSFEELNDSKESLVVLKDQIYFIRYINSKDKYSLYYINTNGNEEKEISENVRSFYISDESLFYLKTEDWTSVDLSNNRNYLFYKARLDGSEEEAINMNRRISSNFIVDGEWIYYIDNNEHKLVKVKIDGTDYTVFRSSGITMMGGINYQDGWIFSGMIMIKSDDSQSQSIEPNNPEYRDQETANLAEEQAKNMVSTYNPNELAFAIDSLSYVSSISVIDDWIFLGSDNSIDVGYVYRIKMDGSIIEKLEDFETPVY